MPSRVPGVALSPSQPLDLFDQRQDLRLEKGAGLGVGPRERGELDRFEREEFDFFERVRQSYLGQAREHPQRYRVVDATRELLSVQQVVRQHGKEFLSQWREGSS